MAKFDLNDDSVVAIIGSGAGGGTLANELCQKGVKVVLLEAGGREEINDFQNDEWGSFGQISWLDKRTTSGTWRVAKDFAGLPAWICKTVGGSTVHWAGASLRFQEHEFRVKSEYGEIAGASLLDWPLTLQDLEPYYAKAEDKMGAGTTPRRVSAAGSLTSIRSSTGSSRRVTFRRVCVSCSVARLTTSPGFWTPPTPSPRRPRRSVPASPNWYGGHSRLSVSNLPGLALRCSREADAWRSPWRRTALACWRESSSSSSARRPPTCLW